MEGLQRNHKIFSFFLIIMGFYQIEHISTQMFNDLEMNVDGNIS